MTHNERRSTGHCVVVVSHDQVHHTLLSHPAAGLLCLSQSDDIRDSSGLKDSLQQFVVVLSHCQHTAGGHLLLLLLEMEELLQDTGRRQVCTAFHELVHLPAHHLLLGVLPLSLLLLTLPPLLLLSQLLLQWLPPVKDVDWRQPLLLQTAVVSQEVANPGMLHTGLMLCVVHGLVHVDCSVYGHTAAAVLSQVGHSSDRLCRILVHEQFEAFDSHGCLTD